MRLRSVPNDQDEAIWEFPFGQFGSSGKENHLGLRLFRRQPSFQTGMLVEDGSH